MDGNQKPTSGVGGANGTGSVPAQPYTPPSLTEPGSSLPPLPQAVAPTPPAAVNPTVTPPATTDTIPSVAPAAAQAMPEAVPPAAASIDANEQAGFYKPSEATLVDDHRISASGFQEAGPVEWVSNSDAFRAHAGTWRLKMSLLAIVGGALIFLITRSYFSAGAIVVAGILFGVLGARPPRPIQYRLDSRGIAVGQKQFSYAEFRAFSVSETSPSINLVPLKRFAPIMVIRCDPTRSEEIVQALSGHLPMESPRHDAVDSITSRLKI